MKSKAAKPPATDSSTSALSPFRRRTFAVIWAATVVANIGGWMYDAASAWMMTTIDADPLMVSLVQVAANLPIFLFALPAGALADMVDQRRLLLFGESLVALASIAFAIIVWMHAVTPLNLLFFTFIGGVAAAITAAPWQSVVPELVSAPELPSAIAANSVGINISRTIGPALGGALTAAFGILLPFALSAVSNFGSIAALLWWKPPRRAADAFPREHLIGAMRAGLRYSRNNSAMLSTLVRAVAFFVFASAYWALLPLVARDRLGGGPQLYGALLAVIGISAVIGATLLPRLKAKLDVDGIAVAGTAGTAIAMFLFGVARSPWIAGIASIVAGISWISVLASLNVSAQLALPTWVRGRGLALYVTVMFGSITLGSTIWGNVALAYGLGVSHYIAASGCLIAIPLTRRWKLRAADIDLTPSMHWPTPLVVGDVKNDAGPVLVTVEYRVVAASRERFLDALERFAKERRRDGAYRWGIFEDVADPGRFLETFLVESWVEHQRQHRRISRADRVKEEEVAKLSEHPPKVTHFVAADPHQRPAPNYTVSSISKPLK